MRRKAIGFGIPADRIETVELPLVQPITPAPEPGEGPVRFLFIGTLLPTKGVERLVNAFARLPAGAASLTLYGPRVPVDTHPRFAERMSERVAEIPGASLNPPFTPGTVNAVLAEADVLVVPSTWEENSPLVLREAQAAGLRVIASEIGGIPELSTTARWVPPDDDDALLVALQTESRLGRRRVAPRSYTGPNEHAADLIGRYRAWARDAQLEPVPDSR
jgi:glycosyltransferase involved in cell wall biosynthesis